MKRILICTATTLSGVFFRAGQKWTKEGTLLVLDDMSEETMTVLSNEPNLNIREATEEDIARLTPDLPGASKADLIDVLVDEIAKLEADAFGKDGNPKLQDLRKASSINGELLTADLRDAAMEKLKKGGFQAPVKAGG